MTALPAEQVRTKAQETAAIQREVVVKAQPRIEAVTSLDLGAKQTLGPSVEVPEELMDEALSMMDEYKAFLKERAELYLDRHAAMKSDSLRGISPEIGQPTVGPYVAWDILSLSPIELGGLPYHQPNKIIRSGSLGLLLAVMWTNPTVDVANGFAVPANIQLGGRQARVSFDRLNLTTGVGGPSSAIVFNLPAVVPPIILIPLFFIAPPVGNSELYELNVTADILDPAQPYAAFGSWHFDFEAEPSWFAGFPPSVPPQLQHDAPNRFMVYQE